MLSFSNKSSKVIGIEHKRKEPSPPYIGRLEIKKYWRPLKLILKIQKN